MKTHTFSFQNPGRVLPNIINDPVLYFSNLPSTQLQFLESFHFFVQQFWLEGSLVPLCKQDVMKHLVHLKITLRRSDVSCSCSIDNFKCEAMMLIFQQWWHWERDTPLAINPYKSFPGGRMNPNDAKVMKAWWAEEEQDPSLKREFDPEYWGSAFQHLPKLKTLTMEFETEKHCEAQIDDVAKHAASGWKFPMGEGRVLSAEGSKVEKKEWEGPPCLRYTAPVFLNIPEQPHRKPDYVGYGVPLVVKVVKWKLVST